MIRSDAYVTLPAPHRSVLRTHSFLLKYEISAHFLGIVAWKVIKERRGGGERRRGEEATVGSYTLVGSC